MKPLVHTLAIIVILLLFTISIAACGDGSTSNAPDDHTKSRGGVKHKPGDPPFVCIACHGESLQGTSSTPSCFNCHNYMFD